MFTSLLALPTVTSVGGEMNLNSGKVIASTAMALSKGGERLLMLIERFLVGIWLLGWYLVAVIAVLGTLGAFQFQAQLASEFTIEEVRIALPELQRKSRLEQDHDQLVRRVEALEREKETREREIENKTAQFQDVNVGRTIEETRESQLLADLISIKDKVGDLNIKVNQLKHNVEGLQGKIDDHKEQYPVFYGEEEKLRKLRKFSDEYLYVQDWQFLGIYVPDFISMPSTLLTLTLTLSMGALGSVIHQTWEFFNKQEGRRLSWYIFRPFLGAVLAFVIYVLLKAGQLFMTNSPEGGTDGADLNPFFISFLAIVSGLLSEQAYARISSAGSSVLQPPEAETLRWVRREVMERALQEQDKHAGQLLRYLGVPPAKLVAWTTEREAVPESAQTTMAAWLSLPSRDLFTDQPPEGADESEPEPTEQATSQPPNGGHV